MHHNKIYLIPQDDKTWSSVVSPGKSSANAVFFLNEGTYPVQLLYDRNDLNGSSVLESVNIADRQALLDTLNWVGKCGYSIEKLWDFNSKSPLSEDVEAVFHAAWEYQYMQERISSAEFYEICMDDSDLFEAPPISWSFQLDNGLLALVERKAVGGKSGFDGNVYDFNIWEPDEDRSRGMLYSGGTLTKEEGIQTLSDAVKWVFHNYSKAALMANGPVSKKPLDSQIKTAQNRTSDSQASKAFRLPQR